MFTYSPGGQATNYVVIFKIERGVSLTHARIQGCCTEAKFNSPKYWSKRETDEAV